MARHTRRSQKGSGTESKKNENKTRKRKYDKGTTIEIKPISPGALIPNQGENDHLEEETFLESNIPIKFSKPSERINVELSVSESGKRKLHVDTRCGELERTEPKMSKIKPKRFEDPQNRNENINIQDIDTKFKRRSGANTCMVLCCSSPRHPGIIYHGFPKPDYPNLQKQWLIACGRALNTSILRHMRVCSNHFDEAAYERDLRNELLGLPSRRKLKLEAVPTLCLSNNSKDIDPPGENKVEINKDNENERAMLPIDLQRRREADALKLAESAVRRKEEVNQIIMMEVAKRNGGIGVTIESEKSDDGRYISHKAVLNTKSKTIPSLPTQGSPIRHQRKMIESPVSEFTALSNGIKTTGNWKSEMDKALLARLNYLEVQNEKQKDIIKCLKQENSKLKCEHHRKNIAKLELKASGYGGPWSEAQIDLILNYPHRNGRLRKSQLVKWSDEDIVKGISLFQKLCLQGEKFAIRMYSEIRKQFYLPVPSLFVIKSWLKQLNFKYGIQSSSLDLLKSTNFIGNSSKEEASALPTFVILLIDELDIGKNNYISPNNNFIKTYKRKNHERVIETCENSRNDDRYITASENRQKLLVKNLALRGLSSSKEWNLPLFFDFDRRALRKNLLLEIISEVEDRTGGMTQVWAVVLSTLKDAELIDELGLNEDVSSFPSPVDHNRSVYCFADSHTLIHQQRKYILEQGIEIQGDSEEKGAPSVKLLRSDFESMITRGVEENVFPELACLDISMNKHPKESLQNMSSNIHILSRKASDGLQMLFPDKKVQAEWIRVWSDFIDLMTQHPLFSNNGNAEGFGEPYLSEKVTILDKMINNLFKTRLLTQKPPKLNGYNHETNIVQLFQKAILWTIKSLKSLYNQIQSYLIAYPDHEGKRNITLQTNRFNFHEYDDNYHRAAQQHMNDSVDRGENFDSSFDINAKINQTFVTKHPKLYQHPLYSLPLKESNSDRRIDGIKSKAGKARKKKRPQSPPPKNPSKIVEYKLSPEGKVHIPFGHPQIYCVKNRNRLEIVSKEPQIKIVYPDDPENTLLMLQQQNFSEQISILQDGREKMQDGNCLQETSLQNEYTTDSATIVIEEEIEDTNDGLDKCEKEESKSEKSIIPVPSNVGQNIVHLNQVDVVDADGNINEHYYIS